MAMAHVQQLWLAPRLLGSPSLAADSNLSALVCVPPDENACPCPEIPLVNLTEPPQKDCFKIGEKFRYTCKAGYLREAGTSNLITCIQDGGVVKWTERYLKCKRKVSLFIFYYLIV